MKTIEISIYENGEARTSGLKGTAVCVNGVYVIAVPEQYQSTLAEIAVQRDWTKVDVVTRPVGA